MFVVVLCDCNAPHKALCIKIYSLIIFGKYHNIVHLYDNDYCICRLNIKFRVQAKKILKTLIKTLHYLCGYYNIVS